MLQLAVVIVAAHVIVLLYVSVCGLLDCYLTYMFNAAIGVFHSGFSYKLLSYGYGLWSCAKQRVYVEYLRWTDFLRLW